MGFVSPFVEGALKTHYQEVLVMKKHIRSAISLLFALGVLMASFATAQAVEPRYTGVAQIYSTLNISNSGAASCSGKVVLRSGYTADLTVELKQDGETIKTWTNSGSGTVTAGGTYYVESGHGYIVTTTATVYDSNDNVIESPSKDSPKSSY